MWTHPGKKLLFMGGEFAERSEWSHDRSLDWDLLREGSHRGVQSLVRDLNVLYRQVRALHVLDCEAAGFEWIDGGDAERSALSYLRLGGPDDGPVAVVCNFTPVVRARYRVGVPRPGRWRIALATDAEAAPASPARKLSWRRTSPPTAVLVPST